MSKGMHDDFTPVRGDGDCENYGHVVDFSARQKKQQGQSTLLVSLKQLREIQSLSDDQQE
jgi:hypothetical protein